MKLLCLFFLCTHAFVEEVVTKHLCPETDWVVPYRHDRGLASTFRSPPRSAVIGTQYLLAVGLAHSLQLRGDRGVVYVSGGDGSVAQGDFYEALNYAALHKLPVIFVIHDDGWANGVPTPMPAPCIEDLCGGRSYLNVETATDSDTFSQAMEHAVTRAREGLGPSVIVIKLPPGGKRVTQEVELAWNPGVVILGQNVTAGLQPSDRCFNTPLAEATIVGVALGMSLDGFHKPIAEIQDGEFLWLAMHQVREIARLQTPLVIRIPYGKYGRNPATALLQFPTLKTFLPSNAADAEVLLKQAIEDPGPVLFLEHPFLYETRGVDYQLPPGRAAIAREGTAVTLVTWGGDVALSLEVAEALAERLDIEVIDVRVLNPLDMPTIVASVKKTGRLVILGDSPQIGAELIAQVTQQAFPSLIAPPRRLANAEELRHLVHKKIDA